MERGSQTPFEAIWGFFIMPKFKTHKEFIENLESKFPNKDYNVIGSYTGVKNNILIDTKYGECLMIADNLLQGKSYSIKSAVDKTNYFLNQIKEVHGDNYLYTDFVYSRAVIKSKIICKVHGCFEQTPNAHLAGKGCIRCALELTGGHSKKDFIKASGGRICTFYIMKLYNDTESFFKIGITSNLISVRFHSTKMPYNYEIIQEIKGEAGEIWDLELKNKRILKNFSYHPLIPFSGRTECFNNILNINNG